MKALCTLATLSLALLLTSCSFIQQVPKDTADTPAADTAPDDKPTSPKATESETPAAAPTASPSEEQQQAARALIAGASDLDPAPDAPGPWNDSTATAQPTTQPTPALPTGGLRMGSIVPQEDPASAGDALPPAANAAERFGLRSPKMPTKLPMGIDGKIKNGQ